MSDTELQEAWQNFGESLVAMVTAAMPTITAFCREVDRLTGTVDGSITEVDPDVLALPAPSPKEAE